MPDLTPIVTAIIALSVAAERVVEIIKGMIPWLGNEQEDAKAEGRRHAALQALAAAAGIFVALLATPVTDAVVPAGQGHGVTVVAMGLLASGGSGFWNSILGYVGNLKELKKAAADAAKADRSPA